MSIYNLCQDVWGIVVGYLKERHIRRLVRCSPHFAELLDSAHLMTAAKKLLPKKLNTVDMCFMDAFPGMLPMLLNAERKECKALLKPPPRSSRTVIQEGLEPLYLSVKKKVDDVMASVCAGNREKTRKQLKEVHEDIQHLKRVLLSPEAITHKESKSIMESTLCLEKVITFHLSKDKNQKLPRLPKTPTAVPESVGAIVEKDGMYNKLHTANKATTSPKGKGNNKAAGTKTINSSLLGNTSQGSSQGPLVVNKRRTHGSGILVG
eukprot:TRINITY_DN75308_c0_g1_i1.p1 TRINITY_DN75308_c0_g1~~TRINITY_DN75308_c0_g1_i1.p1  ORF type:complete len:264 (+),score=32.63 TRINITY_DN75308_c0_g1_i1:22-813(+)